LNKLLIILLTLSLQAPSVARLLVYAECSVNALLRDDKLSCDCMLTHTTSGWDSPFSLPDKQSDLSKKTDWKYVAVEKASFSGSPVITLTTLLKEYQSSLPAPYIGAVFHPPCYSLT